MSTTSDSRIIAIKSGLVGAQEYIDAEIDASAKLLELQDAVESIDETLATLDVKRKALEQDRDKEVARKTELVRQMTNLRDDRMRQDYSAVHAEAMQALAAASEFQNLAYDAEKMKAATDLLMEVLVSLPINDDESLQERLPHLKSVKTQLEEFYNTLEQFEPVGASFFDTLAVTKTKKKGPKPLGRFTLLTNNTAGMSEPRKIGTTFDQVWTVQNTGDTAWPDTTSVQLVVADSNAVLHMKMGIPFYQAYVGKVKAGDTARVTVKIEVPTYTNGDDGNNGRVTLEFKLGALKPTGSGTFKPFGDFLRCKFAIEPPAYECEIEDYLFLQNNVPVTRGPIPRSWLVRNTGTTAWPEDTKIVFKHGNTDVVKPIESEYGVGTVEPGDTTDISVAFTVNTIAEPNAAVYAYFQLVSESGSFGGAGLYVHVHVMGDPDDESLKVSLVEGMPDFMTAEPGTMRLTWRARNVGKTRWPAGARLTCVGGSAFDQNNFRHPLLLGSVEPGDSCSVETYIEIPPTVHKKVTSQWELIADQFKFKGLRQPVFTFTSSITVVKPPLMQNMYRRLVDLANLLLQQCDTIPQLFALAKKARDDMDRFVFAAQNDGKPPSEIEEYIKENKQAERESLKGIHKIVGEMQRTMESLAGKSETTIIATIARRYADILGSELSAWVKCVPETLNEVTSADPEEMFAVLLPSFEKFASRVTRLCAPADDQQQLDYCYWLCVPDERPLAKQANAYTTLATKVNRNADVRNVDDLVAAIDIPKRVGNRGGAKSAKGTNKKKGAKKKK